MFIFKICFMKTESNIQQNEPDCILSSLKQTVINN